MTHVASKYCQCPKCTGDFIHTPKCNCPSCSFRRLIVHKKKYTPLSSELQGLLNAVLDQQEGRAFDGTQLYINNHVRDRTPQTPLDDCRLEEFDEKSDEESDDIKYSVDSLSSTNEVEDMF